MSQDPHLFQNEGERFRKYARFCIDPKSRTLAVYEHHRFFQAKKFDVLYGDIHRDFPALTNKEIQNPFLQQLIIDDYQSFSLCKEHQQVPYEVSLHAIRIQATPNSNIGRPAPEGIHRDGYSFGAIHLMRRENVSGAENFVYDLQKNPIAKVPLRKTMDSILFDDAAIYHGVSPFLQHDPKACATRDMLILLYQPLDESPQPKGLKKNLIRNL